MKPCLWIILGCSVAMLGCSHFGYYKYEKPQRAPPEVSAQVRFPNALEGGAQLTGPMMLALKVAMSDFRPPWIKPEKQQDPEDKCLADWRYIDTTVVQAEENLFYVLFTPDLRQCGPGFVVLDAGALYAIDAQGRILAKE
ncbi:MAG: hypothetical protein ACJ8AT_03465 [Hyalangium sp.]|uniref:hypothetical protein n=1 Tax=Hyalangium sp. TaxID=2028555 RepID=UPI00389B0AD1